MSHAISLKTLVTILVVLATNINLRPTDGVKCFTHDYLVIINNWLPQDSPYPLRLHCKSKDDDLGYHELSVNQNFTWTFCASILENTLFTCEVGWGQAHQGFQAYNSRNQGMCDGGLCFWQARADGIYFRAVDYPEFFKKFDWLNGRS